ncbi:hypothetical protein B0I65_003162 [Clostridium beijerinckii]|uniref:hypothetical protein n=1 Tax=Clostridium beijerinckii TaxID=1520 RepID=UPI001F4C33EC|nr:hypothetical protein [Clostridium beijerinckii]NRU22656.1 hypothetical protein [Clostridium beijerinckii]
MANINAEITINIARNLNEFLKTALLDSDVALAASIFSFITTFISFAISSLNVKYSELYNVIASS